MAKRNQYLTTLQGGYLFPEIIKRKNAFLKANPEAKLINLGIGDTTEPLTPFLSTGLAQKSIELGTSEGYSGYGPEQGIDELRIAVNRELYSNRFTKDEIFISDGINSDIGRLQFLFGQEATIAVQDPTYPVYIDTSIIRGRGKKFNSYSKQYEGISYLQCNSENNFFPDLKQSERKDIIYFCSPNNPTGTAATREQLQKLVAYAKEVKSIILFDAAYAAYIQDPNCPRSIYEIEGAEEVAIEMGSFSKMAGFTGVRLSWSVIPHALYYECGTQIHPDWNRVHCTFFNGASNISQAGGLAALSPQGKKEINQQIQFYLENSRLLKQAIEKKGLTVYGGINAPFLWVKFPGYSSWEMFEFFLKEAHLVTIPGSGFGPGGENFLRLSAFGNRPQIEEAAERIVKLLF